MNASCALRAVAMTAFYRLIRRSTMTRLLATSMHRKRESFPMKERQTFYVDLLLAPEKCNHSMGRPALLSRLAL